jgi:very-short-patch-repair endonuclease
MTDAEKKLWWRLRHIPIEDTHFRRQATIGPYFADFACHEQRLVVEVDGGQHGETNQVKLDERRTSFLEMQGYRVLRFWNNEVMSNIEGVMTVISAALRENANAAPPPLTPPHNAKTRWGRGREKS